MQFLSGNIVSLSFNGLNSKLGFYYSFNKQFLSPQYVLGTVFKKKKKMESYIWDLPAILRNLWLSRQLVVGVIIMSRSDPSDHSPSFLYCHASKILNFYMYHIPQEVNYSHTKLILNHILNLPKLLSLFNKLAYSAPCTFFFTLMRTLNIP